MRSQQQLRAAKTARELIPLEISKTPASDNHQAIEDNEEEDRHIKSKSMPSRLKSKSWWRGVMKSIYASISLLYRQNSKKCEISTSDDSNEDHMTGNFC